MIGIFDSGVGGLTVVKAIRERIPDHDLIYFGDTARTPYGIKSAETVVEYTIENINFLVNHGAVIIVMACNTASSLAFEYARERFSIPIFEVVTPAVELALKISRRLRFGVIGTRATVQSGVYEKKIIENNPEAKIFSIACPLLVPLVEEGWLKKPETAMIVKKYLHPLKIRQIDTLLLGCTHYPLIKALIQRKIGKHVGIVDSSICVAEHLEKYLQNQFDRAHLLRKNGILRLFVSDITHQFEQMAKLTLKENVKLENASV